MRLTSLDSLSMLSPTLSRIARWLEARPWNRPSTDKTWVLEAMLAGLAFRIATRAAERVTADVDVLLPRRVPRTSS